MTPGLTPRKATDFIVIHCSASPPDTATSAKTIDRWHRQRGFLMIGYHYVIKTDGTVETGRDEESIGAHVEGHNINSIGICLVGGVDKDNKSVDNFNDTQKLSLLVLLKELKKKYPKAAIQGHRDFAGVKKDCPCWNVKPWVKKVMNP